MTASLIVAVLEGFEGTLDATIERLERPDMRAEICALRDLVIEKRKRIETAALSDGTRLIAGTETKGSIL